MKHLERLRGVDLLLDTFIYGSHTTAADALWTGIPILTMRGSKFASNVGSSLLDSLGLSELITFNLKEYEDTAVRLATGHELHNKIIEKLSFNILHHAALSSITFSFFFDRMVYSVWDIYLSTRMNASLPHIVIAPQTSTEIDESVFMRILREVPTYSNDSESRTFLERRLKHAFIF